MPDDHYIRAIIPILPASKTGILQMAIPGYEIDDAGNLAMDFARCQAALGHLKTLDARHYICLSTASEIDQEEIDDICDLVRARGISAYHMPVEDYTEPDEAFLQSWAEMSAELHQSLDAGGGVVLQCLAGCGRSGTIAALLLIERGMAPQQAIDTVRAINEESIESAAQQAFLLSRHRL